MKIESIKTSDPGRTTITAQMMNQIRALLLRSIVGGKGIAVNHTGAQLVIQNAQPSIIGRAGNASLYSAANKAALPAVAEPAFGYAQDTKYYYARSDEAWVCVSHLE